MFDTARTFMASPLRCGSFALALATVYSLFYAGAEPVAAGLFPEPWDKLVHFLVYATIAVLLSIAFDGKRPLLLIAAVSAIGALDEWHQMFLPGRSGDIADFLTDEVAAVFAVAAYEYFLMRRTTGSPLTGYCGSDK